MYIWHLRGQSGENGLKSVFKEIMSQKKATKNKNIFKILLKNVLKFKKNESRDILYSQIKLFNFIKW